LKHQNSIKVLFRDGIAALAAHGAAKGDEFPTLSECLINRSDQGVDIAMKKNILRGVVDGGFIIFLFYSNLLMVSRWGRYQLTSAGASTHRSNEQMAGPTFWCHQALEGARRDGRQDRSTTLALGDCLGEELNFTQARG
jgi:hypothetical protein